MQQPTNAMSEGAQLELPVATFWENLQPNWRTAYIYMNDHFEIPFAFCAVYVITIFSIKRIMRDRKPFELTSLVIFWNALLAVFSMIGAYYVITPMLMYIPIVGYHADMCDLKTEYSHPWVYWFCLSKIPELFDTVLIVLRKRPLMFLHWYHHIATLLYCWHAWAVRIENGGWFAAMNLVVHSIMYSYYAMGAMRIRFPNVVRIFITTLQLVQMALGLLIVLHNYEYCMTNPVNTYAGLIMYASYALLFAKLFIDSYITGKRSSSRHPAPSDHKKKQP